MNLVDQTPAIIVLFVFHSIRFIIINSNTTTRDRLTEDYTFGYPDHFDVIGAESHACRERAALFNMSYFGKFFLTGPDSQVRICRQ